LRPHLTAGLPLAAEVLAEVSAVRTQGHRDMDTRTSPELLQKLHLPVGALKFRDHESSVAPRNGSGGIGVHGEQSVDDIRVELLGPVYS
jgi:hypothetical protein